MGDYYFTMKGPFHTDTWRDVRRGKIIPRLKDISDRECAKLCSTSHFCAGREYSKKHIVRNNNSFVLGYPRVKIPLPFHHSFHVEFNMMNLIESGDFYSVKNKLNIIRRYFYGFEYNQDCNDYEK